MACSSQITFKENVNGREGIQNEWRSALGYHHPENYAPFEDLVFPTQTKHVLSFGLGILFQMLSAPICFAVPCIKHDVGRQIRGMHYSKTVLPKTMKCWCVR